MHRERLDLVEVRKTLRKEGSVHFVISVEFGRGLDPHTSQEEDLADNLRTESPEGVIPAGLPVTPIDVLVIIHETVGIDPNLDKPQPTKSKNMRIRSIVMAKRWMEGGSVTTLLTMKMIVPSMNRSWIGLR